MRSRAALLPHPADPFLFTYWLKFFNEVWGDEVDKLYILINSPIEEEVIRYMKTLVLDNPKIDLTYLGYQVEHGQAINELLEKVSEQTVMLIEDDGFIFKKGEVDKWFTMIEEDKTDIVGSPRGSCSMEIYEAARSRYSLNYEGLGDHGPNFWPNFFFIQKGHLLQTDRFFGAKSWKQGEIIEPLNYVVKDEVCPSDTFVNTSLQLREKGLRITEIPQYHASPDDLEHAQRHYNLFDGVAPWTHIGSLSSGVHGVLVDDYGRSLARRLIEAPKESPMVPGQCSTEQERNEWERRVVMWSIFLDYYKNHVVSDPIPEFTMEYEKAIGRIIKQFGLRVDKIEKWKNLYHTIGL